MGEIWNKMLIAWGDPIIIAVIIIFAALLIIAYIAANKQCEEIMKRKKKIFLISPVSTSNPQNYEIVKKYVEKMENEDNEVHWPIRDTEQNDPIGINICDTNSKKIFEWADEIHIYYLKESRGIQFDIGAVYFVIRILGIKKKVVFVNKEDFQNELSEISGKSFIKVIAYLEEQTK